MSSAFEPVRARLSGLGNVHSQGGGAVDRAAAWARRPLDRAFLGRAGRVSEIATLGRDVAARAPAAVGPRVLVLSLRLWPDHATYEAVIALALRMRGAEVALLTCGGGQPICEIGWARRALPRPCDRCIHHTGRVNDAVGLPVYRLSSHLPWGADARRAPSSADSRDPDAVGSLADVSIPWFLRAADPAAVPGSAAAVADFEVAVAGVAAAGEQILDHFRPDVVFGVNGLFAAERTLRADALARGLRAPTYEVAPRAGTLVFSQKRPAPEYDTGEVWERVRHLPLTDAQERALDEQLLGRVHGRTSHESYFDSPEADVAVLRRDLEIPEHARVVSLFTNLSWDSACLHHDIAYPSMLDWIAAAVRAARELPDTVLVVRVHPAEKRWRTRERAEEGVLARVGTIPSNVRIIGSARPVSSYALLDLSDLVLTYTTTVGLEAAVRGIPVAVAGETHYRARGFTYDVACHDDLVAVLRDPPARMAPDRVTLARRYAFTFFFRSMLPFPSVQVTGGRVTRVPVTAAELHGSDPYLDWVADRILDGEPFTLPDELALPDGGS
jgi:hypothetical protein